MLLNANTLSNLSVFLILWAMHAAEGNDAKRDLPEPD